MDNEVFFNKVKYWYSVGLWKKYQVKNAVLKGKLTQEQCDKIIGVENI